MERAPPQGWTCLFSFPEQGTYGTEVYNPFLATYTGISVNPDGQPQVRQEFGIAYTATGASEVEGVIQVSSEDLATFYTFSGPPSGFIRVPIPIAGSELLYHGAMWDPSQREVNVAGIDAAFSEVVWSGRDLPPTQRSDGQTQNWQQELLSSVAFESSTGRLHVRASPPFNDGVQHGDPRGPQSGYASYGASPFPVALAGNVTTSAGSLSFHQPLLTSFFGYFLDVKSPYFTGLAELGCECPGQPGGLLHAVRCELPLGLAS